MEKRKGRGRAMDDAIDLEADDKKVATFLGTPLSKKDIDELDEEERAKRLRGVKPWEQIVTDEKGRRRFHGAFTGGFSAGYFNTVGTAEGWAPSEFRSSRDKRADRREQRVEDFMDEEDLQSATLAGRTIKTTSEFAPQRRPPPPKAAEDADADADMGEGGEGEEEGTGVRDLGLSSHVAQMMVTPTDASIGFRLLKAMGWREGRPVGIAKAKKAPKHIQEALDKMKEQPQPPKHDQDVTTDRSGAAAPPQDVKREDTEQPEPKKAKRVMGCALPPSLALQRDRERAALTGELDPEEERLREAEERRMELERDLQLLLKPKTDFKGIGYVGESLRDLLAPPSVTAAAGSSSEAGGEGGRRRVVRGEAFGIGAFEEAEEWEDIYQLEDKKIFHKSLPAPGDTEDDARPSRGPRALEGPAAPHALTDRERPQVLGLRKTGERRCQTDGRPALPGFVLGDSPLVLPTPEPPPPVPSHFKGRHVPTREELEEADSEEFRQLLEHFKSVRPLKEESKKAADEKKGPLDPSKRGEMLGETPLPDRDSDRHDGSKTEGAAAAAAAGGGRKGGAMWASMSAEMKQNILGSLFPGRSFVRGGTQDMGGERKALHNQPFEKDAEKQKRYERFCDALEGRVQPSQAYADDEKMGKAAAAREREEFGRVYKLFRQSHPEAPSTPAAIEQAEKEEGNAGGGVGLPNAPPSDPGKPVRTSCNWKPERLLCRRFGVPDPWAKQPFFDDSRESEGAAGGGLPSFLDIVQRGVQAASAVGPMGGQMTMDVGGFGPAPGLVPPQPIAQQNGAAAAAATAMDECVEEKEMEPELPRPPISLFKAIFESDSEGEEGG